MSDKKERILIISGSYEDIESLAYRFPWADLDKIHVEEYSRNEAIKEMANAISNDDNLLPHYENLAAIALDALTGDKHE